MMEDDTYQTEAISNNMLYVRPATTIGVCSEDDSVSDKIIKALKKWTDPINRTEYLTVEKTQQAYSFEFVYCDL